MGVVFDRENLTLRYLDDDIAATGNPDGTAANDIPSHPRAPRSVAPTYDHAAMMQYMTQQFTTLQTSMNDKWNSACEAMQKNHNDSTAHLNMVQTEMRENFQYLYSHFHIPPYDPNNSAAPINPVLSLQTMPPSDPSDAPPNTSYMDLS